MENYTRKIYVSSDWHFNHMKMLDYGRLPGFEFELYKNLMALTEMDTLINLGDICIGKDADVHRIIVSNLRCKKILVRGNHDSKSTKWYLEHGWDMVVDGFVMNYKGKKILFTHIPKEASFKYDMNIHGHLHTFERADNDTGVNRIEEMNFDYEPNYHKLVSSEYSNYKPILLDTYV